MTLGGSVGPFTNVSGVLNLARIASQLEAVPYDGLPYSASEFDLKKVLACLAKLLANYHDQVDTWHQLFEDEEYRNRLQWEKLEELYWSDDVSGEKERLVKYTLNTVEAYFADEYRPIMSAFFIKLAGKGVIYEYFCVSIYRYFFSI